MTTLTRREFLKTSGALVVSFAAPPLTGALAQVAGGKPALVPTELDSWIAVLPDGRVQAFFGKMDMGQGLEVVIAQIVADELDVACDKVDVLMGDTGTSCNQGGASGSTGVSNGGRLLRSAAAEARRLLLESGSKRLGVPAEQLRVEEGIILSQDGRKVAYSELVGGKYFHHPVEWNKQVGNAMDIKVRAKPKTPQEYRVVGKSFARRDVAWKVYGTDRFVTDVRVKGMLHARVIRPPRAACKVRGVDEASIRSIRGARVVREKDFVAVVAPREWDAVRAAQMLKVDWHALDGAFPAMDSLHEHIRSAKVVKREEPVKKGDLAAAFSAPGVRIVEAQYEWPFQSHASMGPGCAVADAKADRCTVWTGSQKPHFVRDGVAKLLGMAPEKVRAIWVAGPGSYGRNDAGDAALDAAFLSKAAGKPVRVQGMRADGTAWDPKGPACVHRARAAIDASGKVIGYEFVAKGFSRQHIATNESDPADSLVGQATGIPAKGTQIFGVPAESYGFENKLLAWETIAPLVENCSPLRTAHMRDPVGPEIHFGAEQFIDELAAAVGEDPVAFRLRYLTDPRHQAVVKAAAEKAGWQARNSSERTMKGRGIAFAERNGTAVAAVAEVEVERSTGRIWARRVVVAHDCGLVINPQGLRYTIEGNVVQGISRAVYEQVRFDRDAVSSVDWASYPILEMQDAPAAIEVVLINRPEVAPSGAGEPTMRVIPAAVANAFFDATGVRLRKAPLNAERVKAALSRA
ncbi:MAG: xanthine dehydrogenase family protein molybdopterin-binding subunit [Betaproteobacteria bacterium]|nr:MAG: xanthine dehydrogenase family protein molybdopterin-binding subunit [Betaproteobacteria bacterium]